ncbi:MAG TPA: DUF4384 domain-containing protein [Nitrospira sp.]|nr:DUF4384 domain-containing protein [Nitrospira sp.]
MTTTGYRTAIERWYKQDVLLAWLSPLVLSSCAAAPFLLPIAFEFARNLIQTGLSNYGSKHRDNLSNLVDRLASPYMQGLPPMAVTNPGAPGQPAMMGQPGFPAQPNMLQQQYPGQQTLAGQPGAYDPNNPYSGMPQSYQGSTSNNPYGQQPINPYGTAGGYQYGTQNPYGTSNTYGQQNSYGTNQYGQQNPYATGQYGQQNTYGTGQYGQQNPSGTTGQYGTGNPYGGQSQYGGTSGSQQPYDPNNPYGQSTQSTYGQTYGQPGYGTPSTYGAQQPYGGTSGYQQQPYDPNNPYSQSTQSAYGQTHGQPAYGSSSPYGTQQPSYGGTSGTTGQPYGTQPYGGSAYGNQAYGSGTIYGRGLGEPVAVDVAMIRQKHTDKVKEVVLMNDGEVLKDGGANKEAGDRFKIVVRTNCDCYLYITSIDGSGWAEPVFPAKESRTVNPVKKDQEYAFPESGHWYTLDQIKGIESFFIVASANRRLDLEESLAKLAAEKRPNTKIVAKVEEPPVIPRGVGSVTTRGILKVQDETGTAVQVTPLSYAATPPSQDVTVTRWFKHE